jgi:hypothetical protein
MIKYLLILIFFPAYLYSQSFSSPESVEYDSANNRWLVGQSGSGAVLVYSPSSSTLTNFYTGLPSGPHGIEILGNVLYCCSGGRIMGIDLTTASLVFNLNLNATFLNGLTSDGVNYLFATDFSAKKIYRVNVSATTYNLMVTTLKTPNGIIYDGEHNRCVFVTWGTSAPVQAMSLADSSISTLRSTSLSNCDGIMRDQQGNWYATSWGTNALNKFDSAFTSNPVTVMSSLSSPADLGINSAGDSIGIPNSGSANNVVFYHIPVPTGLGNNLPSEVASLFPNPAEDHLTILLDNPVLNGVIELSDVTGKILLQQKADGNIFILNRLGLPAGIYHVVVKNKNGEIILTRKVIYGS